MAGDDAMPDFAALAAKAPDELIAPVCRLVPVHEVVWRGRDPARRTGELRELLVLLQRAVQQRLPSAHPLARRAWSFNDFVEAAGAVDQPALSAPAGGASGGRR